MTTTTETIARDILTANGQPDPHPMLLADTMREVAYHGMTTPAKEQGPVECGEAEGNPHEATYTVEKDSMEIPCEHIACDTIHQRVYNVDHGHPTLIELYNLAGDVIGTRWESRAHVLTRVQWIVLRDGVVVGDAPATKRAALEQAATRPTR